LVLLSSLEEELVLKKPEQGPRRRELEPTKLEQALS